MRFKYIICLTFVSLLLVYVIYNYNIIEQFSMNNPKPILTSNLTTNYSKEFAEIYQGSNKATLEPLYYGRNLWAKSFNNGLELHNQKQKSYDKYSGYFIKDEHSPVISYFEPKYPMAKSLTGLFYETTPPPANI
jgi:hypothetical protein